MHYRSHVLRHWSLAVGLSCVWSLGKAEELSMLLRCLVTRRILWIYIFSREFYFKLVLLCIVFFRDHFLLFQTRKVHSLLIVGWPIAAISAGEYLFLSFRDWENAFLLSTNSCYISVWILLSTYSAGLSFLIYSDIWEVCQGIVDVVNFEF